MWSFLQHWPWGRHQGSAAPKEPEVVACSQCLLCVHACPTGALRYVDRIWHLELDQCHFCGDCAEICPNLLIAKQAAPPALKS